MCKEIYRLPLCELANEHKEEVKKVMQNLKLI